MRVRLFTVLAVLAIAGARGAHAADSDAFAARMFAGKVAAQGKSYACFARRYDKAHLAQHRQQKVTAMKLLVSAEYVADDKALNYGFAMNVKFRYRSGKYDSGGSCGHPHAEQEGADKLILDCGVDCDGGGLDIEMVNAGRSILVKTERIAIWRTDAKPGNEDENDREAFNGGDDDKAFRLDRVSVDECRSLMPKDDGEQKTSALEVK